MISAIRFPPLTWSGREPGWILRDKNRGIRSINHSPLWAEGENLKGPRWETLLGLRNHWYHPDGSDLSGPGSVCVDRLLPFGGDLLSLQTSSKPQDMKWSLMWFCSGPEVTRVYHGSTGGRTNTRGSFRDFSLHLFNWTSSSYSTW